MSNHTVFADFYNANPAGRLRLNCKGTFDDLAQQKIELSEGLLIKLSDGDELEADGVVQYSADEQIWVAVINWNLL